jgi:hypothetical protein
VWLRINGEGQESAEEVRANHITNTLPRFTPGLEFKEALDRIKYTKAVSPETPLPLVGDIRQAPIPTDSQPD